MGGNNAALGTAARPETARPEQAGGRCLIPAGDPISGFLEDVRLEKSSYEVLEFDAGCNLCQHTGSDLVGLFVLGGEVEITPMKGAPERLQCHNFILFTPRQSYRLTILPGAEACRIGRVTYSLDLGRARLLFKLLPPALVVRDIEPWELQWQMSLAQLIAKQSMVGNPANAAINRRLVEAALIGVIQQFLIHGGRSGEHMTDPLLARISPSLQAIHQAPDQPWTVASLAHLAGMSRTMFTSLFSARTGETPAQYLTHLRMERAREMLQRSQLPLAAIAHRAGYGTDVAFARAFRRQFGISPGRFRADRH